MKTMTIELTSASKYAKGTRLLIKVKKEAFLGTVTATRQGEVFVLLDNGEKVKVKERSKLILGEGIKRKIKKPISLDDIDSALKSKGIEEKRNAEKKAQGQKAYASKSEIKQYINEIYKVLKGNLKFVDKILIQNNSVHIVTSNKEVIRSNLYKRILEKDFKQADRSLMKDFSAKLSNLLIKKLKVKISNNKIMFYNNAKFYISYVPLNTYDYKLNKAYVYLDIKISAYDKDDI